MRRYASRFFSLIKVSAREAISIWNKSCFIIVSAVDTIISSPTLYSSPPLLRNRSIVTDPSSSIDPFLSIFFFYSTNLSIILSTGRLFFFFSFFGSLFSCFPLRKSMTQCRSLIADHKFSSSIVVYEIALNSTTRQQIDLETTDERS